MLQKKYLTIYYFIVLSFIINYGNAGNAKTKAILNPIFVPPVISAGINHVSNYSVTINTPRDLIYKDSDLTITWTLVGTQTSKATLSIVDTHTKKRTIIDSCVDLSKEKKIWKINVPAANYKLTICMVDDQLSVSSDNFKIYPAKSDESHHSHHSNSPCKTEKPHHSHHSNSPCKTEKTHPPSSSPCKTEKTLPPSSSPCTTKKTLPPSSSPCTTKSETPTPSSPTNSGGALISPSSTNSGGTPISPSSPANTTNSGGTPSKEDKPNTDSIVTIVVSIVGAFAVIVSAIITARCVKKGKYSNNKIILV